MASNWPNFSSTCLIRPSNYCLMHFYKRLQWWLLYGFVLFFLSLSAMLSYLTYLSMHLNIIDLFSQPLLQYIVKPVREYRISLQQKANFLLKDVLYEFIIQPSLLITSQLSITPAFSCGLREWHEIFFYLILILISSK